jgi:tRNA (guanine37-N1)-methyltransferase
MRLDVLTLFPEMITSAASFGITGRAQEREIIDLCAWNPRDYTHDKHKTVDDRPYGGGPGMVMKCQPLYDALTAAKQAHADHAKVVYLSPQGRQLTQALLAEAIALPRLILVAGRYEGVDERFITQYCDEEWSIGDYVLSGGELAALVIIDAMTRLIPGALGDEDSAQQDSHVDGLLDCPHYTRPDVINGKAVPDVLVSGNHADIIRWRTKQALGKTWQKRPDLLNGKQLTTEQQALLDEFINEVGIEN